MIAWLLPFLTGLICVLFLTGCDQICPIVWSPTGETMVFLSSDGLRFGDANGHLSSACFNNATRAAWLPDSQHLLVADSRTIRTWTEAAEYLSGQQKKEAIELSQYFKQQLLLHGDDDSFSDDYKLKSHSISIVEAAILYLKDNENNLLKQKLQSKTWNSFQDTTCSVKTISLIEVANNQITHRKELWRGFSTIKDMRIAPDGKFALVMLEKEIESKSEPNDIVLISLDFPRASVKVAESLAPHADWSLDSQQIFFFASEGKNTESILGSLSSLKVRDDQGYPLANLQAPVRLVYLMIDQSSDLRCLKNGRILFSAADVELPATDKEIPRTKNVFAWRPGDLFARRLMSKNDANLMEDITSLQTNPDGTWTALYNSEKGNLGLLNIDTGEVIERRVQSTYDPSWRNSNEICFVQTIDKKTAKQHDDEVMLFSLSTKKDQIISADWPRNAINGFLIHKKEK